MFAFMSNLRVNKTQHLNEARNNKNNVKVGHSTEQWLHNRHTCFALNGIIIMQYPICPNTALRAFSGPEQLAAT